MTDKTSPQSIETIRSRRIVGKDGFFPGEVLVDGAGTVVDVIDRSGSADGFDVLETVVAPSILDIHFHGAAGVPVPPDGEVDDLNRAISTSIGSRHSRCHYEYIATLPIPGDSTSLIDQVEVAAKKTSAQNTNEIGQAATARCRGLRIEGCFINPEVAGVWPTESFMSPAKGIELVKQLMDVCHEAGTRLLVIDIAPELPGAISLIEYCVENRIVVALAHTNATYEQAVNGFKAGATISTHTWNAMRAVHHREPGIVTAALLEPSTYCELIADGHHVHPRVLELTLRAKVDLSRIISVSDASPFAGCNDGTYRWSSGLEVHLADGCLRDAQGNLAGSAIFVDESLKHLMDAGLTAYEAICAMTVNPESVIDPDATRGLKPGDRLWLVDI